MIPVYLCYLVFQLFSHKQLYEDDSSDIAKSTRYAPSVNIRIFSREKAPSDTVVPNGTTGQDEEQGGTLPEKKEKEEEEQPSMSLPLTIGLLVVVTVVRSSSP